MLGIKLGTDEIGRVIFIVHGQQFEVEDDARLFSAASAMKSILKDMVKTAVDDQTLWNTLKEEAKNILTYISGSFADETMATQRKLQLIKTILDDEDDLDEGDVIKAIKEVF